MPVIFRNPVAVHRGAAAASLASLIQGRRYLLVTSKGWSHRGALTEIERACGSAAGLVDEVTENPTFQQLLTFENRLAAFSTSPGVVVALGGGSVMDAAKAIAAALAPGCTMSGIVDIARAGTSLPPELKPWPIYCVPTTAGTGSEVTSTATLWDGPTGAKFSLADPRLFPQAAVLDASLLASAPPDLMLSTGLDALSHAMESIWSRHHNPVSDACAVSAIRRIRRHLPAAVGGRAQDARAELQTASLLAGFAISATRTGLAHSISYPLTGRFGLRHGLACSFTLPAVAAFVLEDAPERAALIADAFGSRTASEFPAVLREWLDGLGVYDAVRRVVDPSRVSELRGALLAKGRADNSLRQVSAEDAEAILRTSLAASVPAQKSLPDSSSSGRVIWITGLSGAGKTTIARALAARRRAAGKQVVFLDGDEMREVFKTAVGFSGADRRALAGHYSRLCRLLASQGHEVICATMSLFHDCQEWNRLNIPNYLEVYLHVDPAVLIQRDPRQLYSRALRGEIRDVAGVDLPYEAPLSPDLTIDRSGDVDVNTAVDLVLGLIEAGARTPLELSQGAGSRRAL